MNYGRNDPCWCASGLKYKKCHLNRDKQQPVNKQKIFKQLNSFYNYKTCSAPKSIKHECSKNIIKAHSISKSSSLKEIAKDGHVLTTFEATTIGANEIKIAPKKIGINRASTFTGFCAHHDNALFHEIEDKDFEITEQNCFLVAYRALARELFVKNRVSSTLEMAKELDKGMSLPFQKRHQAVQGYLSKSNDLSTSDLTHIKEILDNCYQSTKFQQVNHIVFTLDAVPKIMTSAAVAPTVDFQGNLIQTISSDPKIIPHYLIVNIFSSNNTGYIVLSWIEEHHNTCVKLYKSLIKTASPEDSLTVFIFAMIENIYLSEEWWNKIGEDDNNYLMEVFSQGIKKHTDNDVLVTSKNFNCFNITDTRLIGFKL